jgi:hypothetical protein
MNLVNASKSTEIRGKPPRLFSFHGSTALTFVIPSVAEGSAVSLQRKPMHVFSQLTYSNPAKSSAGSLIANPVMCRREASCM